MSHQPRRWPAHAESHRQEADQCAEESEQLLAQSARLLAEASTAVQRGNPDKAELLIARAALATAQARALQERIRRVLEIAKHGRP